jgi:lipoate-protein ligase A
LYKVYISDSFNPYFNLAFEEHLVKTADKNENILFLWQNDRTVVIGRNQNPWKECDLAKLKKNGGNLVRRLSGGGAVYHDLGNLNYTFISYFQEHAITSNIEIILKSLKMSEVSAHFSGKNDILAKDSKISGNAFFVENETLCHHGTLLIDTDKEKLAQYLTVSEQKLKSKGLSSVQSRVVNLKELNKDITIEKVKKSLIEIFLSKESNFNVIHVSEALTRGAMIADLMKKYESWEWNYGSSPQFDLQLAERFPWGEVQLNLYIEDGIVKEVKLYSDAIDVDFPEKIERAIKNLRFQKNEIAKAIESLKHENGSDIIIMINSMEF